MLFTDLYYVTTSTPTHTHTHTHTCARTGKFLAKADILAEFTKPSTMPGTQQILNYLSNDRFCPSQTFPKSWVCLVFLARVDCHFSFDPFSQFLLIFILLAPTQRKTEQGAQKSTLMVTETYSPSATGRGAEGQLKCFLRAKALRIDLIH